MNYLDTVIERGLLSLFISQLENKQGDKTVSISSEILKDGVATAKAIQEIRDTFQSSQGLGVMNPLNSIAPPQPVPAPKKSPRVHSNETMLSAELEGLQKLVADRDETIKILNAQLGKAYSVVEEHRESFTKELEEMKSKVFDMQHSVYEVLSSSEE